MIDLTRAVVSGQDVVVMSVERYDWMAVRMDLFVELHNADVNIQTKMLYEFSELAKKYLESNPEVGMAIMYHVGIAIASMEEQKQLIERVKETHNVV